MMSSKSNTYQIGQKAIHVEVAWLEQVRVGSREPERDSSRRRVTLFTKFQHNGKVEEPGPLPGASAVKRKAEDACVLRESFPRLV
jgi:hypothetical protein